jgi:hypothetical protein
MAGRQLSALIALERSGRFENHASHRARHPLCEGHSEGRGVLSAPFWVEAAAVFGKGWLELAGETGSCNLALHQAASSQKSGAAIKIVFSVADVMKFKREREADGLKFGPVHQPGDFEFANTKDPAGNSIQISSRGLTRISAS